MEMQCSGAWAAACLNNLSTTLGTELGAATWIMAPLTQVTAQCLFADYKPMKWHLEIQQKYGWIKEVPVNIKYIFIFCICNINKGPDRLLNQW